MLIFDRCMLRDEVNDMTADAFGYMWLIPNEDVKSTDESFKNLGES